MVLGVSLGGKRVSPGYEVIPQIFNTLLYKYTVDQQGGIKNIFLHLDCWVLGNNLKSRGSASKDGRTS